MPSRPPFPREVARAIRLPAAGGTPRRPVSLTPPRTGEKTMNIHDPNIATPEGHHRPAAGSRKIYATPEAAPDLRVPLREIALDASLRASRRFRSTTPSGPYTDPTTSTIDVEKGLARIAHRLGEGARRRRGIRRPADPAGRQRQRHRQAPRRRDFPNTPRPLRALDGKPVTQFECARAGIITKEMIYVAERENLGRKQQLERARGGARRRRELRRRDARLHHAGIRARRDRARPRHHPGQHQPRRTRADDHRPQLPREDQRQHRQLGRHLLGRGRSREDGLGDPLGRRHGDGPLHRPQHPQHPRMDHAQLAGADRHRADLPGAGEGRRRSRSSSTGSSTGTR